MLVLERLERVFESVGRWEFEGERGKEEFVEQMDLYEVEERLGCFGVKKAT